MPGISDAIKKLNERGKEASDEEKGKETAKGTSAAQQHIDKPAGMVEPKAEAEADYSSAEHELGGVTKITRGAGSADHGKPSSGHVVQQGGGGTPIPG